MKVYLPFGPQDLNTWGEGEEDGTSENNNETVDGTKRHEGDVNCESTERDVRGKGVLESEKMVTIGKFLNV